MKKTLILLSFLLTAIVFAACSDNDNAANGYYVSFEQSNYVLNNNSGETATVTVKGLAPATSDVTIPFVVTGAGTEDVVVSDTKFEIKAGESTAQVTVTRKNVGQPKSITLTLRDAGGVRIGAMDYVQVQLIGANVYSFSESNATLFGNQTYSVNLETADGKRFSYPTETKLELAIDPTSTAEEGVDFAFEGGRKVVFAPEKSSGTLALKFLKKREGHDKLVLRLAEGQNLIAGNHPTLTVNIVEPDNYSGVWAFARMSNDQWLQDNYGVAGNLLVDGKPETDYFTLAGTSDSYTFTPNFTGKLKNYFTAAGKAVKLNTRREVMQEEGGYPPKRVMITVLKIDNVNLNISPVDKTIGTYRVGFHKQINGDTGVEELVMTIYEYKPTDTTPGSMGSWADIYDMNNYDASDPVMLTTPLRVVFTRKL